MNTSEPQKLSWGFVAWLDVLGYKQVLSSDRGAAASDAKLEVWQKVLSVLRNVREQQFEHALTEFLKSGRGLRESSYRSTAFTDSIVTSVDLSGADEFDQWCLETLFLRRTAFLSRLMFEEGLPIRGGIAYGHFIHGEQGFAGGPFVEAEALSSRLELSACAFTQDAIECIRRIHQNRPPWSRFEANQWWFRYDQCPVKPKIVPCGPLINHPHQSNSLVATPMTEAMYMLNFASRGCLKATNDASEFKIDFSGKDSDLNACVTNVFGSHGKPINENSIKMKIRNTVKMLESARQAADTLFS